MKVFFVGVAARGRWEGIDRQLPTFQQLDLELLRSLGHEVRSLAWYGRELGSLLRGARWADVVYCWHIGSHAFAASFVASNLACVVGGYEFANLPELDYGNLRNPWLRALTRRVWRNADALLYIDPSLLEEAAQGFGHPGNAYYLPPGFDTSFWTPGNTEKENLVLTVTDAPTPQRIQLKGVDRFVDMARRCPDLQFAVAGNLPATLPNAPPNLELLGWLEPGQLRDVYRRASVYCQLSRREAFGYAVCEAMLCGCVPIGTRVGGIATAIGDAGHIVSWDAVEITKTIREAMSEETLRRKAREHVASRFPLERRRSELKAILERLVPRGL